MLTRQHHSASSPSSTRALTQSRRRATARAAVTTQRTPREFTANPFVYTPNPRHLRWSDDEGMSFDVEYQLDADVADLLRGGAL